jgi:hypothetical protein
LYSYRAQVAGKMAAQLNAHPAGFRLYVDQALVKARPPPA